MLAPPLTPGPEKSHCQLIPRRKMTTVAAGVAVRVGVAVAIEVGVGVAEGVGLNVGVTVAVTRGGGV
jgi:hypothetical protein